MKIVRRSTRVTTTVFLDTVRINFVYKQDSVFTAMSVLHGNANVSENKTKSMSIKRSYPEMALIGMSGFLVG